MADKMIIGLTGNIATGKSLVLRMLQELGVTTIDADKLVHQLMRRGGSAYQAIVEEFGKFILDDKGQISRSRLGKIVFSDPKALSKLESLTHPAVIQEIQSRAESAPTPVVAVEAIKLFEAGIADHCQSVWVVTAPREQQYRRLIERRRMSPDQAKQRIMAQTSQQENVAKADVVIDNSGALAKTWATVKKHYLELVEHKSEAAQTAEAEPSPTEVAPTPAPESNGAPSDEVEDITVRRAKRDDLAAMAKLVAAGTDNAIDPDTSEMMEALFSRAYMVAMTDNYVVGMVGWQTENLVAGLQDFYVLREELWSMVGEQILEKVHEEINSLSCEVALIFVLDQAGSMPIEFLESQGYEQAESDSLIPDWREAAVEWQPENSVMLYKKIREQRIMVPM